MAQKYYTFQNHLTNARNENKLDSTLFIIYIIHLEKIPGSVKYEKRNHIIIILHIKLI